MTKETIKVDAKDSDREHICGFCKWLKYNHGGAPLEFNCTNKDSPHYEKRRNYENHCGKWKERK